MAAKDLLANSDVHLWDQWAERRGFNVEDIDEEDEELEKETEKQKESHAMKLRKEDMSIFGFCPSHDDFYLVVCEVEGCGRVVKPQGLKSHIELRHGSEVFSSWIEENESTAQRTKAPVIKTASHTIPNKPVPSHNARTSTSKHKSNATPSSSNSNHAVALPIVSSEDFNSSSKAEKPKSHPKTKKNNTLAPVVRVERITQSQVKTTNSPLNTLPVNTELPSPQQPPPDVPIVSSMICSTAKEDMSSPVVAVLSTTSSLVETVTSVENSFERNEDSSHLQKKPIAPSKTNKKAAKERKILDREYNPNKHCEVISVDTGKTCTKSLSYITMHSLSSRRTVISRKKEVDNLSDHRATKESVLKLVKTKASISESVSPIIQTVERTEAENVSNVQSPVTEPTGVAVITATTTTTSYTTVTNNLRTSTGPFSSENIGGGIQPLSPSIMPTVLPQTDNKKVILQNFQPSRVPPDIIQIAEKLKSVPEIEAEPDELKLEPGSESGPEEPEPVFIKGITPDPNYITHYPRPSAVCTFGLRKLPTGKIITDPRFLTVREALKLALSMRKIDKYKEEIPIKAHASSLIVKQEDTQNPCKYSESIAAMPVQQSTLSKLSVASVDKEIITSDIHPSSSCATSTTKVKPVSQVPIMVPSHKPQPKTLTSKTKEKNSSSKGLNSPPSKRKRTVATVPNGTNVSPVMTQPTVHPSLDGVPSFPLQQSISLPPAFSIVDNFGALSRFPPGVLTIAGAPQHVMAKGNDIVGFNGQIPVSDIMHSMTVNRPLLPSPASGLGITLGAAGLIGHFSHFPKGTRQEDLCNPTSSNKNSCTIGSILHNSQIFANAPAATSSSTWCRTKKNSKSRKNSTSVNSVPQNVCDGPVGGGFFHLSLRGNTANVLQPHLPSPVSESPLVHSGSSSPLVPVSSPPLHNGLGPSPPSCSNPMSISPMSNSQPLCLSPGSTASINSPGSAASTNSPKRDWSSSGSTSSGPKGKDFSLLLPESLPVQTAINAAHSTFQLSLPLTITEIERESSSPSSVGELQNDQITFQSFLANATLVDEQLYQPKPRQTQKNDQTLEVTTNVTLSSTTLAIKMPLLMPPLSSSCQLLQLPSEILRKNGVSTDTSFSIQKM